VIDVTGWGGKTKTYELQVDSTGWSPTGLTLPQVLQAVSNANINVGWQHRQYRAHPPWCAASA